MFLEKLELQGFKSFSSKTILRFDNGITGIVGPNGSGKSNIADAIRWVLGEQSMKSLRSKKSDDVIFVGTPSRSRMGMAEVSLYLNNEEGRTPVEYDHLVITRRVFRDGEGEYLINKNRVRLLDIQELLLKCGFGQKTYSVIGQGMIDSFLRATPRERKELFEEAAGVKQYQVKRNLSINKLEQTKQNLLRVKDHLDELLPRLRSLKRQAGRARRKGEIEKELKDLQKKYFNHSWNQVILNYKNVLNIIDGIKKEEKSAQENLKKNEKSLLEIVHGSSYINSKEQEMVVKLHDEKNKIQENLAILRGKIQIENEKSISFNLQNLMTRKRDKEQELDEIKKNIDKMKHTLDGFKEKLNEKIISCRNTFSELNNLQGQLLPKNPQNQDLIEIEKEIDEFFEGQKRLAERLEKTQNLNELKAIIVLAREYLLKLKNIISKIRQVRRNAGVTDNNEIKRIQEKVEKISQLKEEKEKEINEQKIQLAVFETRYDLYQEQILQKEKELKKIQKQISSISLERKNQDLKIMEEEKNRLEKNLQDIQTKLNEIEGKFRIKQEKEEERRAQIINFESEYKKAQDFLNQVKDKMREVEIHKAKIENGKTLLFNEIRDDFGEIAIQEMTEGFLRDPYKFDSDKEKEFKEKIQSFKRQFLQIGEIDPQVVNECGEVEKRYNFLTSQKEDLEKAIDSLKQIISELDEKITISFDLAIKGINEQFQKYFEILFGGGKARLLKKKYEAEKIEALPGEEGEKAESLILEKNRDEFYIDIKITLPGKRIQDLNLLSGGERALTSIALILAIVAHNPSPFIVLDEVDAALDEANSSRYAKIIADVSQKTQFITITHNREAMRRAKVLYGVTMEENGISKLLSIDLEKINDA